MRYVNTGSAVTIANDVGQGATFNFTQAMTEALNGYHVMLNVSAGTVCNNVVIKPMIRYAEVTDPTFKKYAMTNEELTESLGDIESLLAEV